MNAKRRLLALLTLLALVISLVSCSAIGNFSSSDADFGGAMDSTFGESYDDGGSYGDGGYKGSYDSALGDSDADADYEAPSEPGSSESGEADTSKPDEKPDDTTTITRPAGLITAGAWNDNDNYEYWQSLFEQSAEGKNGKFFEYSGAKAWGFDSYGRLKATVTLVDGTPVAGAAVVARDSKDEAVFSAVTDANGIAYLFTSLDGGKITADSGEYSNTVIYNGEQGENVTIELAGSAEKKNIIDVMFVVDVTGSMGDELNYLKNELRDVINRVAAMDKNAVINLALLFYRDKGDSVPFAYYDFMDVTDAKALDLQQANLEARFAQGGGDYPEAVDEALLMAVEKQWNTSATTKLIFHILDAPPHSKDSNKQTFMSAVNIAAEKGIRICPIICSGTDTLTEYLMRQAAIYTAGTFIFITDDSGIGNSHYDPGLPNVTVEALNSLLVRLIDGYHSGKFDPPVYWKEEQLNNQNKQ